MFIIVKVSKLIYAYVVHRFYNTALVECWLRHRNLQILRNENLSRSFYRQNFSKHFSTLTAIDKTLERPSNVISVVKVFIGIYGVSLRSVMTQ